MKIYCECGNLLPDNTDSLPFKAHFVPNQVVFGVTDDLEQLFLEALERSKHEEINVEDYLNRLHTVYFKETRLIYQCGQCGRLFIWSRDKHGTYSFIPEQRETPTNLLAARVGKERGN